MTDPHKSKGNKRSTTRTAILTAAEAQFRETGYRNSLLTQITDRADLTTGALYRYFDGKESLLESLFNLFDERLLEDLENSSTAQEAVEAWILAARDAAGTIQACEEATRPGSDFAILVAPARARWISALASILPGDATARQHRTTAELLCAMAEQYLVVERMGWTKVRTPAEVAACIQTLVETGVDVRDVTADESNNRSQATRDDSPQSKTGDQRLVTPVLAWAPSPDKVKPTSPRGKATSDKISQAAVRVLDRIDLVDATVLDIATEAGVASGTVYRYFVDKHDILLSLLAQVEEELIQFTQTEIQPGPEGEIGVRTGLLAFLEIYRRHAPLFRAWVNIMRPGSDLARSWNQSRHLFLDRVAGFLRRGQRAGNINPSLDPELTAELLMATSERSNYVRVILGWDEGTDDGIADALSTLFTVGSNPPA